MSRLLLVAAILTALLLPAVGDARGGDRSGGSKGRTVNVRSYTKKDGAYVNPHHRTAPDGSKSNNWSTKGNVNPYTGKQGTKNP
jgi:hypothetical protein